MQTETLKVSGMTCNGCTSKVTRVLNAINGVDEVEVSLPNGQATVRYDEQLTTLDQLKSAVRGAGYEVDAAKDIHGKQAKGGCCG